MLKSAEYGLGIYETKLPNGVSIWGHAGASPGFSTFAGGTLGGKYTLAINLNSMKLVIVLLILLKIFLLAEFSSKKKRKVTLFIDKNIPFGSKK